MPEQIVVQYLPIAVLFGIAVFLAVLLPILSVSLGPRRPSRRKSMPYESGMTPIGEAQRRVPVKFYRIAVLFIIFDIDIILLVPWAITFREIGLFGLIEIFVFIFIFLLGFVWVWRKGVLEWE